MRLLQKKRVSEESIPHENKISSFAPAQPPICELLVFSCLRYGIKKASNKDSRLPIGLVGDQQAEPLSTLIDPIVCLCFFRKYNQVNPN